MGLGGLLEHTRFRFFSNDVADIVIRRISKNSAQTLRSLNTFCTQSITPIRRFLAVSNKINRLLCRRNCRESSYQC